MKSNQQEFEFKLILSGINELNQHVEDALFEAGCDDALLGFRSGECFLLFSRHAPTMKDAVQTAIRDVRSAGIGADVIRVEHDDSITTDEISETLATA